MAFAMVGETRGSAPRLGFLGLLLIGGLSAIATVGVCRAETTFAPPDISEQATGAGALIKEAQALYDLSLLAGDPEKIMGFRRVKILLDRVIDEYPASDEALNLLLGVLVGTIDTAMIDAALKQSESAPAQSSGTSTMAPTLAAPQQPATLSDRLASCFAAAADNSVAGDRPTPLVVRAALDQAGGITGLPDLVDPAVPEAGSRRRFLRVLSALDACAPYDLTETTSVLSVTIQSDGTFVVGRQPVPQLEALPAKSEKELIAAEQVELNRMRCGAGTPDGVAGSKTKRALRIFASVTGTLIDPDAPASEATLSILKAQTNPVCTSRWVVANVPAAAAGGWNYTAICPMLFVRVRVTGYFNLRAAGPGEFSGSISNSQGMNGSIYARVSGSNVSAEIRWSGASPTAASLYTSTSSFTLSGTDTVGCKISARKS